MCSLPEVGGGAMWWPRARDATRRDFLRRPGRLSSSLELCLPSRLRLHSRSSSAYLIDQEGVELSLPGRLVHETVWSGRGVYDQSTLSGCLGLRPRHIARTLGVGHVADRGRRRGHVAVQPRHVAEVAVQPRPASARDTSPPCQYAEPKARRSSPCPTPTSSLPYSIYPS